MSAMHKRIGGSLLIATVFTILIFVRPGQPFTTTDLVSWVASGLF